MKKINFYIHTLGGGGAEKALINLVNNLDKDKYSIQVTTIIDTGRYIEELDAKITYQTIFKIPKKIKKSLTNESGAIRKNKDSIGNKNRLQNLYFFFWKYLSWSLIPISWYQNRGNDIIISFLEGPTHIFVANIPTKARKVSWVHVDLSNERKSEKFFKNMQQNKKSYLKFDHIVAVSKNVKWSLENYIGLKKQKPISVIYNAYDEQKILNMAEQNKTILEENIMNIVTVGRLSYQKGYDRLIKAVSKNINPKIPYKIYILGDGENRVSLEKLILDLGVSDRVIIKGFVRNPYTYIKQSNVFIAPSRTEGYSTVVVESIIIGTPVIVTDCSGMDEILNGGNYGDIVENSTRAIEEALFNLSQSEEYLKSLVEKVGKAKDIYKLDKSIERIDSFLENLR